MSSIGGIVSLTGKGTLMQAVPLSSRMDLIKEIYEVNSAVFPPFIVAHPSEHTEKCLSIFADFQKVIVADDVLVASGLTVPICWTPGHEMPAGWFEVIEQAVLDYDRGIAPTAICGLSIGIRPSWQGRGIGARLVREMRETARVHGIEHLILPVRPTLKDRYPLIPMAEYMDWQRPDGSAFDPWLRVHQREGATRQGVAVDAMVIRGTVSQWEQWSSLQMNSSGRYVVSGALSPVEIDIENNLGIYREDNVWVSHHLPVHATP